ncbi:MAG TPA: TIR domain-containing protein, partial [Anaerolineales bacterium]|nr:TIR domain-containing protein [Anaerolineales bacterium]
MVGERRRQLKVFLCHASGDKPPVRNLYKRLVVEGVDVWLDQEKLLPGQDWQVEIPRAVREADVVIICLSNKSITKEGYIQKEIRFALDSAEEKPEGTIFLIPARLEDCVVPERLNRWQWVDLFEENGFVRLLRSLKLRADRVGAVIEPAGYESEDQETERRLDQFYTEGLAAFYTEDWDRAYQRFQSILRERPNHTNAAEKLAQAQRQRDLTKLYAQAAEAYESENWPAAIQALEELLGKSGNYKDAAQLLKDAKKRRQLRELYAEAKTLHAAQKWQAVIRVFDQIAGIDPAYSDPEGLLSSAQQEVAELKRLADLNDLYRQGIHKMEAGQWYEARDLLEQVHKAHIGFLETERLLRKVENEILRIEEGRKRNAQVQMLYEQAHKMTRAGQWTKALAQMEEIQKLDNQFVDGDGIVEKSKAELGREEQEAQRRRELASLYAEAVSLLEAKKYQEALEKWNAIQAIDPRYRDTYRVKKTARRKLDELSRPEAAGRPLPRQITNWFRAEANIPADREILTERLLLLSFATVLIIVLVYLVVADLTRIREASAVARFLSLFSVGGLYGIVVALTLSKTISSWHRKQSLIVIVGWALAQSVPWIARQYFAVDFITIYALFAGLSTTVAIKWAKPATRPITLIIIFASWVLAWQVGGLLGSYLQEIFNSQYVGAIADPLSVLLGLLFTFGMQVEG